MIKRNHQVEKEKFYTPITQINNKTEHHNLDGDVSARQYKLTFKKNQTKKIQELRQQGRYYLNLFLEDPSIIKQWDYQTAYIIANVNTFNECDTKDPQRLEQIRQFDKALDEHLEQQHRREMKQISRRGKEMLKRYRKPNIFTKQFWKNLFCGNDTNEDNSCVEQEDEDKYQEFAADVKQLIQRSQEKKVIKTENATYIIKPQPKYGFIEGTNIPKSKHPSLYKIFQ